MIPKHCKRLAEVDFPIAEVGNEVATREKKFPVPRGMPSTLHFWPARRPITSSRAMLLGLLLPDPADDLCPQQFKQDARTILRAMKSRPTGWDAKLKTDQGLRRVLFDFISNFAKWDNAANPEYLRAGRSLIAAAHTNETPLVTDTFAGGGSIPLEALRLGCDTFASDLNPVACLILKVMLENIPRHGQKLSDDLRRVSAEIKAQTERELADLYPKDADGATPIAYMWVRTVRCESPNCGAEIPLMRSMWLCSKANRKRALRPVIARAAGETLRVDFQIFEPQDDKEVSAGTIRRAKAVCPCCRITLPPPRVRAQISEQRGGADTVFDDNGNRIGGARMTAVVTLKPGERIRHYRLPTSADYAAARKAQARITALLDDWERGGKQGLCPVPDEPTPLGQGSGAGRAFSVHRYGMLEWGDLFTARQKYAYILLSNKIADLYNDKETREVAELMQMAFGKIVDFNSSLSTWRQSEDIRSLFGRYAIPMFFDFAETNYANETYVGIDRAVNHVLRVVAHLESSIQREGIVHQSDALNHPLPDQSANVWFTDPPYYDSIPYAELSDFFMAWMKRALPSHPALRDPFDNTNPLSPKFSEVVQDETKEVNGQFKDREWFESSMAKAFAEGRRILRDDGIGSVVFAHKTTEGWEAFLSGMIRGGWTITASWPILTESATRLRAQDSAALATSVHLVCRPRADDAPVGDWDAALRELPVRVGAWMERLQREGVRGADLVFACVGPALEIFSRYSRVETAAGDAVGLPEYLERVWETVGRVALERVLGAAEARARNGALGALEEDSRLTALFLWTLQSGDSAEDGGSPTRYAAGYRLPYDVARRFAQPLGIHLDEWQDRIVEIRKGEARLLPVKERAKALLGDAGADALADDLEASPVSPQLGLFPDLPPEIRGRSRRANRAADADFDPAARRDATTLDRVHAAMLLQRAGRSAALRALLAAEQERGAGFMRLANALSALYPRGSEEKRLLDAMLLAAPR